jgi:hypothetical protein
MINEMSLFLSQYPKTTGDSRHQESGSARTRRMSKAAQTAVD